jgi:hypothetical protein
MKDSTNYSSKFLFEFSLDLYKFYNYLGIKSVPIVAATSLADGVMGKYLGVGRNYFGLTAFWGYIANSTISDLDSSKYVADKYKISLKLLVALCATGMVWKGHDFIESKDEDYNKILKSATVSAKLFESSHREVTKVENSFNKGLSNGLYEIKNNLGDLLGNKFLYSVLAKQSVNILKMAVVEKFFSGVAPNSKLSIYYASQENGGFEKISKNLGLLALKFLITKLADVTVNKVLNIDQDVSIKVSEMILDNKATTTVMKLGGAANSFSNDIKAANQTVNKGINDLAEKLIVPYIYASNVSNNSSSGDLINVCKLGG